MLRHGSVVRPRMCLASLEIKKAFDEARPRHVARLMENHDTRMVNCGLFAPDVRVTGKGDLRMLAEEWVDTTRITWREVTGVCGFSDGSFVNGRCGRSIVLMAFSEPHGWFLFYKKCGLMLKWVDAEMLTDNLRQWMEKCARSKRAIVRTIEIFVVSSPLQCTFRWHASHLGGP